MAMLFLCECRGPCRRSLELTLSTYSWLRSMGAVVTPDCAERDQSTVLYRYNGHVVVTLTHGARVRPPRSL